MPVVTVQMLPGRTPRQKADLVEAMTKAMVDIARAPREGVHVIITEVTAEHWAMGGQFLAERAKVR